MSEPLVTVLSSRHVYGWDGDPDRLPGLEPLPVKPVLEALGTVYKTDAHVWPGVVRSLATGAAEPRGVRLNKAALAPLRQAGYDAKFGVIVIDVDSEEAHRTSELAAQEWVDSFWVAVNGLAGSVYQNPCWYSTRGGMRLLWRLSREVTVEELQKLLAVVCGDMVAAGLKKVDFLMDWTRTYRLPFVVRDGRPQRLTAEWNHLMDGALDVEPLLRRSTFVSVGAAVSGGKKFELPEVIDHDRNVTLTKYAGRLWNTGVSQAELLDGLRLMNASRCRPPLEDSEVVHIAEGASRWDRKEVKVEALPALPVEATGVEVGQVPTFKLGSEAEVSGVLIERLEAGSTARVVYCRGYLWCYVGARGVWQAYPEGALEDAIRGWDGAWVACPSEKNPDGVKPLKVGKHLIQNSIWCVQMARANAGFFDSRKPGVCVDGAFLMARGGVIEAHPPAAEHRARLVCDWKFLPDTVPEKVIAALRVTYHEDPEADAKVQLFREFVGVALLGQATRMAKALLLYDELKGGTGKSTLFRLAQLLFPKGSAVVSIPPEQLSSEYRRALLAGAALNIVAEVPGDVLVRSDELKAAITGDPMDARHIHQSPFTFCNEAAFMLGCNTLMKPKDDSDGFWRRWLIVTHENPIPAHLRDDDLIGRLADDVEELSKFGSWCLEGGAQALLRGVYSVPDGSKAALARWRYDSDSVAQFADEHLVAGDELFTPVRHIHQKYVEWKGATRAPGPILSEADFCLRLEKRGFTRHRTNTARGFRCRVTA